MKNLKKRERDDLDFSVVEPSEESLVVHRSKMKYCIFYTENVITLQATARIYVQW